jgi:tRNA (guanine-N7-)-methyltransferase
VPTAIFRPADFFALLNWDSVFSTPAPIEIEIGCGKGAFLAWAARNRPQHNFLGVERQMIRLRKVDSKVQRIGLANVRLLRIEAGYLVGKMIPDNSVAAYHIFFPDPWPKRRHQAHRLLGPAFVLELHRTLQKGGAVNVATDDATYFAGIQKVFSNSGKFTSVEPVSLPVEAQTEFEKMFLAQGLVINRGRYVSA